MSAQVDIVLKAKDEASKAIEAVGAQLSGLGVKAGGLGAVGVALGAVGAAAAGAGALVFKAAKDFANTWETLDRLSSSTGATIEQLQVLDTVFVNAGLSSEVANKALLRLSKSIGMNDPALKALGITTRDATEALFQLSAIFQKSGDNSTKVALASKLLGKGMLEATSVITDLGAAYDDTRTKMLAAGAIMSGQGQAGAKALDAALDDMRITLAGLTNQFAEAAVPAVIEFMRVLSDAFARNKDTISGFFRELSFQLADMVLEFEAMGARMQEIPLQIAHAWQVSVGMLGALLAGSSDEWSRTTEKLEADIDRLEKKYQNAADRIQALWSEKNTPPPNPAEERFNKLGEPMLLDEGKATPKRKPGAGDEFDFDTSKADARAKRLEEIGNLLRVNQKEAAGLLDVLTKVEQDAARMKLSAEVKVALESMSEAEVQKLVDQWKLVAPIKGITVDAKTGEAINDDLRKQIGKLQLEAVVGTAADTDVKLRAIKPPPMPTVSDKVSEDQIKAWEEQARRVLATMGEVHEAVIDVGIGWMEALNNATSAAGMLDSGLNAAFYGIQSGLDAFFSGMNRRTHVLQSLFATVFKSIADQAIRELNRIATSALFKFVLKLIGFSVGGPVGAAIGGAGAVAGTGVSLPEQMPDFARQPVQEFEPPPAPVVNVQVEAPEVNVTAPPARVVVQPVSAQRVTPPAAPALARPVVPPATAARVAPAATPAPPPQRTAQAPPAPAQPPIRPPAPPTTRPATSPAERRPVASAPLRVQVPPPLAVDIPPPLKVEAPDLRVDAPAPLKVETPDPLKVAVPPPLKVQAPAPARVTSAAPAQTSAAASAEPVVVKIQPPPPAQVRVVPLRETVREVLRTVVQRVVAPARVPGPTPVTVRVAVPAPAPTPVSVRVAAPPPTRVVRQADQLRVQVAQVGAGIRQAPAPPPIRQPSLERAIGAGAAVTARLDKSLGTLWQGTARLLRAVPPAPQRAAIAQLVRPVATIARTVASATRDTASATRTDRTREVTVDRRTFVINAVDAHDLVMSLTLPNGRFRKAGDLVAIEGSY